MRLFRHLRTVSDEYFFFVWKVGTSVVVLFSSEDKEKKKPNRDVKLGYDSGVIEIHLLSINRLCENKMTLWP